MSGGRGLALLCLSEGLYWRSFKAGPTSLCTTGILPKSGAFPCLCQRQADPAAIWGRDPQGRVLTKRWRGRFPPVEILSQGHNTWSFLSV